MIGEPRPVGIGLARSHLGICVVGFVVLLSCFVCASSQNTATNFSLLSFTESTIECVGNSSLTPTNHTLSGAICLSPPDVSNPQLSGRCYYKNRIHFSDNTSFSTMFSFNTLKFPGYGEGQGFTFFIGDRDFNATSVSQGEYLGLPSQNVTGQSSKLNQYFAVEFDLLDQPRFGDPSYVHVGIDVNSLQSVKVAKPKFNITSTSTIEKIYVWIEYEGRSKRVDVSLNKEPKKPCKTLLSTFLNQSLSEILTPQSTIGFSSASGGEYNSQTTVWAWSFSTAGPATDIFHGHANCRRTLSGRAIAAIVISVLSLALVLALGLVFVLYRRASEKSEENESLIQVNADIEKDRERLLSQLKRLDFGAREFTYQQLKEATDGFRNEIGRGGFGTVFKGTLQGVGAVAVKEIKRTTQNVDDAKQLVAEVQVIGRLRHANIVPLRGWCYDEGVMLLVYEFVDNADLHTHLFPKEPSEFLSWERRVKALRGVAAALAFLHEEFESEERVIHRDVKPTNVMLDSKFNARLGDFGLARLSKRTALGYHSGTLAFTPGYAAPEYHLGGTTQTDVYSFGVLVLVVATGRMPQDRRIPGQPGLIRWVRDLYDEGRIVEAGDTALRNDSDWSSHDREEMEEVLKMGLSCCVYEPSDRPTMREALTALYRTSMTLSATLPPHFPAQVEYPLFENSDLNFTSDYSDSSSMLSDSLGNPYHSKESFSITIGSSRR